MTQPNAIPVMRWAAAHNRRSGFVLIAVIFGLLIMSVVAVGALRTSDDDLRAARAIRDSGLALYAAEAGLRKTVGTWPAAAAALAPGDSVDLGWVSLPFGASYRAVIAAVAGGLRPAYTVVAHGRSGDGPAQRTVHEMVINVPTYRWGVFAEGDITMSGANGLSDSYNSSAGPYAAATAGNGGSLVANGDVTLNNGTVVKGDVTAAGTVADAAGVTGTVTSNATPFAPYPTVACPAGGYTLAASVPGGPGITYHASTGVLSIAGNTTLVLTGTQYYFSSVTLTGGASLTVTDGTQHTDIFVENSLNLAGGGITNTSLTAAQLNISACGTPASPAPWTLAGGAGAYFTVYAPNHDVGIVGNGDLFGAIIANNLSASGNGHVHFDEALRSVPSDRLVILRGSWAELAP